MELWFKSANSAEASHLVRELELTLRQHGIPAAAIALKPSSAENMDVGSVLSFSLEVANQVLGPVGTIASVVSCIHQMMERYNRGIVVERDGGREEIAPSRGSRARLEAALTASPKPKPKSGSKSEPKRRSRG
jgi:hypothetical protein